MELNPDANGIDNDDSRMPFKTECQAIVWPYLLWWNENK